MAISYTETVFDSFRQCLRFVKNVPKAVTDEVSRLRHGMRCGLPRRFAPRNDMEEFSAFLFQLRLWCVDSSTRVRSLGMTNGAVRRNAAAIRIRQKGEKGKKPFSPRDRVCKPGSVLTAIYLDLRLPTGSSHLLGTARRAVCSSTVLLQDRVYIVKPMLPWAEWALTPLFHPCLHCKQCVSGISLLHLS